MDINVYTILVTGSRNWRDAKIIRAAILDVIKDKPLNKIRLVHGDQRGADKIAAFVARQLRIAAIKPYGAQWDIYGNSAGPIRNQQILDEEHHIDVVLAFPLPQSIGTCDMIQRAKKHGIKDIRIYGKGCDI